MNASKDRERLRILLVEDHTHLRVVLQEYITNMAFVGRCDAAPDAETAIQSIGDTAPDFVLIDLSLPGMSGIELIRELRKKFSELPLAILSGHHSLNYARDALEAGADGYVLKGDLDEIARGIHAIRAGRRYVSEGLGADP